MTARVERAVLTWRRPTLTIEVTLAGGALARGLSVALQVVG